MYFSVEIAIQRANVRDMLVKQTTETKERKKKIKREIHFIGH